MMMVNITPPMNCKIKSICCIAHKYQSRLDIRISGGFLCLNEGGESVG